MDRAVHITRLAQLGSNLSLLTAILACLILGSGITLLVDPSLAGSVLPSKGAAGREPIPQTRRPLTSLLVFWLPLGLGVAACGVGIATLAWGREVPPVVSRRALLALILSAVPGSLCTLWYLAFSAAPVLEH